MRESTKAARASGKCQLVVEFASRHDLLKFIANWNTYELDEGERKVAAYDMPRNEILGDCYVLRHEGERPEMMQLKE